MSLFSITVLILITLINGKKDCDDIVGWRREPQNDLSTFTAQAGGLASVDDSLYHVLGFERECFDGRICDNTYHDAKDVFKYDIDDNKWLTVNVDDSNGNLPNDRVFFGITSYNSKKEKCTACPKNSVVIYGGVQFNVFFSEFEIFDDFWYFSLNDNKWYEINVDINNSDLPGLLSAVRILANGDYIYLFGGANSFFQPTNDLYYYSWNTNTWTLINVNNPLNKPSPRFGVVFLYNKLNNNNEELIVGVGGAGFGVSASGDIWSYSIQNNEWTELTNVNNRITNGLSNGAGAIDSKTGNIYIFFGDDENNDVECFTRFSVAAGQSIINHTYVFSRDLNDLILVDDMFNIFSPNLKRPVATTLDKKIYVMGGYDYLCDRTNNDTRASGVPVYNKQLYSLDIKSIDFD